MVADLRPVPPRDAIAALMARGKRLEESFSWLDVWEELHAQQFTVAKSAGFDILADIHAALVKALSEGTTLKQFGDALTPILQEKGWWGRQMVVDPDTGEMRAAQLGSTRRLATIFNANMRVSYASGHWASFERNKRTRPFLRYVHVDPELHDPNSRRAHARQHNVTLPVDHPHWKLWACPNGWGCRCTFQSLSQRDVDRLLREGEQLKFEPPADTFMNFVNKRTGEVTRVPDGIDPGWAYNPGQAGFRALPLADKLVSAPAELAAEVNGDQEWLVRKIGPEFETWFDQAAAGSRVDQATVTIGALPRQVVDSLRAAGTEPASGAITLTQTTVRHMVRDAKAEAGKAVPVELLRDLPARLVRPRAVLRSKASGELLYVLDVPGEARAGKIVIRLDYVSKAKGPAGKRVGITTNMIRTAGLVDEAVLRDANAYDVIMGGL